MAFCNSCGANLEQGAKFCNKCGAVAPMTGTHPVATSTPASSAPPQKSNAVKIILIVVAVIVGLGILGIGTTAFLAWRFAKSTHVEQSGENVRVETPFGTVESSQNSEEVARTLGEFMYPGAEPVEGGSSTATIGGTHTANAQLETDDPPAKVAEFYRSKFPDANYTSAQGNTYTIVAADKNNREWTTVTITSEGNRTRIQISRVTRS